MCKKNLFKQLSRRAARLEQNKKKKQQNKIENENVHK